MATNICIKNIFSCILDAFQTLANSSLDSTRLLLKLPGPLVARGPVISHSAAWSDEVLLLNLKDTTDALDRGLLEFIVKALKSAVGDSLARAVE
ncbi:unnamed protein product [Fusarium venenatum]|uniref:Uncharacterized protein n=1 Tax=Fusarium venenatum TaxID=56646 RepID=A0A2L2T561_9HYPO|nr:uncharacterized protein FVRRES_11699 [Fusarium venenatum]CEI39008.1 unnamed protein product [Fusarium venenatum]